ncbi:MAG: T9SS type A sorting domain-containing protein, partial [Saprospiraceae bacterium]
IHATNDVIYLYGNELTGRFWLDDTTSVGFDPYSYSNTWDGVIAMDTARKHLWHRVVKGAHPGRGNSGFAIDSNNDIYFGSAIGQPYTTMFVDSIPISKAMYILKMNSQGDIIRIIEPDQVGANTWVRGVSLTVDDFDNLYVVGSFIQDSISFGGLPPIVANNNHRSFIVKFDSSGNALWQREIDDGYVIPNDLIVDPNGNLYISGTYAQGQDLVIGNLMIPLLDSFQDYTGHFLAKLSEDGTPLLLKDITGYSDSIGNYSHYAIDQVQMEKATDGYVLSSTFKKADFGDGVIHTRNEKSLFLAKYNFNDSLIWLKLTPPLTGTDVSSSSLDINSNGEIFWLHQLYGGGNWTLDGVTAYPHNMMQFDAQGQVMCIEHLAHFKVAANESAVYTMSEYSSFIQFTSILYFDKWEIGNCQKIWERDIEREIFWGSTQKIDVSDNINLYPNPVLDAFTIELETAKIGAMNYQIFNINGQMVKNGQFVSSHSLNVQELNTGIYFLKIYFDGKMYAKKFVKL